MRQRSFILLCLAFKSFRRVYSFPLYFSSTLRRYYSLRSLLRLCRRLPFSLARQVRQKSPSDSLELVGVGFTFSSCPTLSYNSSALAFIFLSSAWEYSNYLLTFSSLFLLVLSCNFLSSSTWSLRCVAVKQYLLAFICSARALRYPLMIFLSFLNSFLSQSYLTLQSCNCLCSMIQLLLLFSTSLAQAYSNSPNCKASCRHFISIQYFPLPNSSSSRRNALLAAAASALLSLLFLTSPISSLFLATNFYISLLNSRYSSSILDQSSLYSSLLRAADRLYLFIKDLLRERESDYCQERIFWIAALLDQSSSALRRMAAYRALAFYVVTAFFDYNLEFSSRNVSQRRLSAASSSSSLSSLRACLASEARNSPMMKSDCFSFSAPKVSAYLASLARCTRYANWAISTSTAPREYSKDEHFWSRVERTLCWSLVMLLMRAAMGWRRCLIGDGVWGMGIFRSDSYLRMLLIICFVNRQ